MRQYITSKFVADIFSVLLQAFFLAHALLIMICGHHVNFSQTEKITKSHYLVVIPAFLILFFIILIARRKIQWIANNLTLVAWFVYGIVLSLTTAQPSVVLGVILVSIGFTIYTKSKLYILPYTFIFFAIRFFMLLMQHGSHHPEYFKALPSFPMISTETAIGILLFSPIIIFTFAWWSLDKIKMKRFSVVEKIPLFNYRVLLLVALIIHVGWSGWILTMRLSTLTSSTYDMGIFTQMFHYMSRSGLPLTTLERDVLLSHFKVHMSPALYLLLPIFKLFPNPFTLQLSQIALTAYGAFPVYWLAKHYGLSQRARLIWTSLYLLLPGIIFSNFYDFHENVLLAPLLLFTVYFIAKGKIAGTIISFLLTMMVKEDAFLYLVVISLFLFFGRHERKSTSFKPRTSIILAISMLLISIGWFIFALHYLSNQGMGAMTGRFDNLTGIPKWGILSIIPTVLLNWTLFIETIFVRAKMGFLLMALASTGFIPLLNKKFHRLFFWIPLIVINLMSNYLYQYDIDFQYHYGSYIFLFLLALTTYADNRSEAADDLHALTKEQILTEAIPSLKHITIRRKSFPHPINNRSTKTIVNFLLLLAIIASMTQSSLLLKKKSQPFRHVGAKEAARLYPERLELLKKIPRDHIVIADTFLTLHMADIKELYDFDYYDWDKPRQLPEYIVLRKAITYRPEKYEHVIKLGFLEVEALSTDWLLVLKRGD